MQAGGAPDIPSLAGNLAGRRPALRVNPDQDEANDTRLTRSFEHRVPVFIEGREVQVAVGVDDRHYLTVTLFARLRGLSGSSPLATASSRPSNWAGTTIASGLALPTSATGRCTSKTGSSIGETPMMNPPRLFSSIAPEMISVCVSSLGANAMHGVPSSIKAMTPCLSSPAAKPSACIYDTSLILSADSSAVGKFR